MDVVLNREFPLSGTSEKGSFGLTLFNLYNRQNTWYKKFNVVEGERSSRTIFSSWGAR